jgi:AhpD family alkylhydroperoxidase
MDTAFPILTPDTAPDASRPALEKLRASVGMIPNLAGAMALSPPLIHAFVTLRAQLESSGTFGPVERELVSLTNATENGCHYCTAIHATFGIRAGLPADTIERARSGGTPIDPKLAALTAFTRRLLHTRGNVGDAALGEFLAAGFTRDQALELVARLALSVIANYSGHLTQVEPDDAIRPMYRGA